MNTVQINKALAVDPFISKILLGVFPCNQIPKKCTPNTCFVANTDSSSEKGSHWVCFYADNYGYCTFFDSYGQNPSSNKYFKKYLQTAAGFERNTVRLQGQLSTCCGQYCILYLFLRSRGYPHNQCMALFGSNLSENDFFVTKWVNKQFGLQLDTLDIEFTVAQIARNL